MQHVSQSENDIIEIARKLAADLKPGDVLLLQGNLGAGKTVFARALIRALTGDTRLEVPSPTFTLVQNYDTPRGPLAHFDLYRLKDPDEVLELGWDDALAEGIVLIEWPERLKSLIPPRHLDIRIAPVDNSPDKRNIDITRV